MKINIYTTSSVRSWKIVMFFWIRFKFWDDVNLDTWLVLLLCFVRDVAPKKFNDIFQKLKKWKKVGDSSYWYGIHIYI